MRAHTRSESKKVKEIFKRDSSPSIPRILHGSNSTSNMMRLNRIPNNLSTPFQMKTREMSQCYEDSANDKENSKANGFTSHHHPMLPMIKKNKMTGYIKKKNCFLQDSNNTSYRTNGNNNASTVNPFSVSKITQGLHDHESKDNSIPHLLPLTCKGTKRSSLQAFLNLNDNTHSHTISKQKQSIQTVQKENFLKKVYSSSSMTTIKPKEVKNQSLNKSNDEKDKKMQLFKNNLDNETDGLAPEIKPKSILRIYAGKSQPGKSEGQITKINQDSFLIMTNVNGIADYNLFGVFDGHGANGHLVSEYVKHFFKKSIESNEELNELTTLDKVYRKLKENDYYLIKQLFKTAEQNLSHVDFDVNFSGTTGVVLFQLGQKIMCANVGDSRAILITPSSSQSKATPLSFDQKPNNVKEKKRIEKSGGKVEKFSEFGIKTGPFRVWLKNELYPGLAMSRSIGDLVASSIGVISEPEIIETELSASSSYIIVASDGLWEFIDNNQAANMTREFLGRNDPEGLCSKLILKATKAWEKNDVVIDDITVITAFFND